MNPLHYVDSYWEMFSRWLGDGCLLADSLHDLQGEASAGFERCCAFLWPRGCYEQQLNLWLHKQDSEKQGEKQSVTS